MINRNGMSSLEMMRQNFFLESGQLGAQFYTAQKAREAENRSRLASAEEKLQAEIAEHLEDKKKLLQQKGSEYR